MHCNFLPCILWKQDWQGRKHNEERTMQRRVFIAEINTLHVADIVGFIFEVGQMNTLCCFGSLHCAVWQWRFWPNCWKPLSWNPSWNQCCLFVVQQWRPVVMTLSPCRQWTFTKRRWPGGRSASSPLTKTRQGLIRSLHRRTWSGRSGTSGSPLTTTFWMTSATVSRWVAAFHSDHT